jgi:hypothetical protein
MVRHTLKTALAVLAAIICVVASAGAQTIGAGTGIANDEVDTPATGGRINVDNTTPLSLGAGTYTATLFTFDAGQPGDVTPFLATETSPNVFRAIAVGATQNLLGNELDTSLPFGGSAVFTLATTTTVFAGISSNTQNPIFLDNGVGLTDHEAAGAPSYTVTVGGVVPPDGSFSNPDLGRTYAFSVTVAAIPEPSSIGLMLLGGTVLLGMRRRRA